MNITLRAGEKLYINGAVIRVDRKATIELLNDVTFLLENHVLQADQATTPLRQIYFAVQVMLMDPGATAAATGLSRRLIDAALQAFENPAIIAGLKTIVGADRPFAQLRGAEGAAGAVPARRAGNVSRRGARQVARSLKGPTMTRHRHLQPSAAPPRVDVVDLVDALASTHVAELQLVSHPSAGGNEEPGSDAADGPDARW